MYISITGYEALCNLGNNIDIIYEKALNGDTSCFKDSDTYIQDKLIRIGEINCELPNIPYLDFNTRCNRLLLKTLELLNDKILRMLTKYPSDRIGVIAATTNSGVEEYEISGNQIHAELGNPAYFLMRHLGLKGFQASVSTACASGIKAFSLARDLINSNIADAVIAVHADSLAKVPLYGFNSLEVLSNEPSIPFSKNRIGMNIGEACAVFILEKNAEAGINIMGIGESSDIYHTTTPDPYGKAAVMAIKIALKDAKIKPSDIDYINAHGTGTLSNDIMEANAIAEIFKDKVPVSSTKPLTGHCLGAAAGIETALCCKLLDDFKGRLYPHLYDENYDDALPPLKLVKKNENYSQCKICMCNAFGFGGTNAILILGKK